MDKDMTFEIKQYGNLVIASTEDQVWKSWMAEDFNERKMNNFIKKIQREQNNTAKFEIKL